MINIGVFILKSFFMFLVLSTYVGSYVACTRSLPRKPTTPMTFCPLTKTPRRWPPPVHGRTAPHPEIWPRPGRRHNLQDLFLVPQAAAAQSGPSSSRTPVHRRDTMSTSRAVAVAGAAVFGRNGITSRYMAPPGRRQNLQDLFLVRHVAAAQSGPSSLRTP